MAKKIAFLTLHGMGTTKRDYYERQAARSGVSQVLNYQFSVSGSHGAVGFKIHNSRPDPILLPGADPRAGPPASRESRPAPESAFRHAQNLRRLRLARLPTMGLSVNILELH